MALRPALLKDRPRLALGNGPLARGQLTNRIVAAAEAVNKAVVKSLVQTTRMQSPCKSVSDVVQWWWWL